MTVVQTALEILGTVLWVGILAVAVVAILVAGFRR
jgi:hypothetical protein